MGLPARKVGHEGHHPLTLGLADRQGLFAIDLQCALLALEQRARVEKIGALALAQPIQQLFHQAMRGLGLDPIGLALLQGGAIAIEEDFAQSLRIARLEPQALRPDAQAGQHANQVPTGGRQDGFIEVIQVEIGQAVVALETAEILKVQVAT